jgi:hypothetical protein
MESVMTSVGKGCHKSWLQQLEPESSEILRVELVKWTVPVTSEYSGRAAVFREELQSCRRTDPGILEEMQRVKIQCEDSASEL